MDDPQRRLERAVAWLVQGDREAARIEIDSIDRLALVVSRQNAHAQYWGPGGVARKFRSQGPSNKRERVSTAVKHSIFDRDRFHCRYLHCRRKTIDLRVLKLLSKALPAVMPYHPNWRPLADHIVYWSLSTSLDHVVPFPSGGTSAPENLVTACYQCNDLKNSIPISVLGWELTEPCMDDWRGLSDLLPELKRAVAATDEGHSTR